MHFYPDDFENLTLVLYIFADRLILKYNTEPHRECFELFTSTKQILNKICLTFKINNHIEWSSEEGI